MLKDILFMLVLFAANTVQTITGFAGSLLAMPPSFLLEGYETSKTVLNIFTLAACAWIAYENRKFIQWTVLVKMLSFMLLGMAFGITVLGRLNLNILLYAYGAMILLVALQNLFLKKEPDLPKWAQYLALFLGGIFHGLFISGGALLVLYAVKALPEKEKFRATVAPVWVVLDTVLIYQHAVSGYYTARNLFLIAFSMVPMVLSIIIGNRIYYRINQQTFRKITYVLVLIAGIMIFV